jgi:transcriptional regulator NrdR family protein
MSKEKVKVTSVLVVRADGKRERFDRHAIISMGAIDTFRNAMKEEFTAKVILLTYEEINNENHEGEFCHSQGVLRANTVADG